MKTNKPMKFGLIGAGIAAVCCATPVLVIALAAMGAGAAVVWLDYVLLPMLFMSLVMAGYGYWRLRQDG